MVKNNKFVNEKDWMCCAEIESEAGAHLVGTCVYAVLASLQVRKQRRTKK